MIVGIMICEAESYSAARDAARLFSSKRINEIASGDFSYLLKVAAHYSNNLQEQFSVKDIFEHSYQAISKDYRSEYFFKNTVAERLLLGRHSLNTATVLPEFRVGRSKADCVILNGSSTCYEIKSDFDNLDRLPDQLSSYRKIFDKVFVVVGKSHVEKVKTICENDVGILELTSRKSLRIIQDAKSSTTPLDVSTLMRSLRVHEYKEIASIISQKDINCSNIEIFSVCEDILNKASSSEVRKAFCSTLKKSRKIEQDYILALPRSLLMAGIGFKLNAKNRRYLIENLSRTFNKGALCITQSYEESSLS